MSAPAKPGAGPVPRLRPYDGPAILSYGFRPFFLFGASWSALAMVAWLLAMTGRVEIPTLFPPLVWHTHEMLFGFAVAAVAGFALTAVPNWTGRLPLQGHPLLVLVLLWAAGRLAVTGSAFIGGWTAALIDVAFPALLSLAVAREIVAGRNWRNLPVVAALFALTVTQGLFHVEALRPDGDTGLPARFAIAILVALITLIGGRIVPSFTRNWLAKRGIGRLPAPFGPLDRIALAATVAGLAAWVVAPSSLGTGALVALAAAANIARLGRWAGDRTLSEPLVWVLHIAYLWVPAGLLLLAVHAWQNEVPATAGIHALTAGAIGSMILAVMTRASLGHTGRALHAGPGTTLIYVLALAAAVARVAAALVPSLYDPLLMASGGLWVAAFALFAILYAPALTTRRTA